MKRFNYYLVLGLCCGFLSVQAQNELIQAPTENFLLIGHYEDVDNDAELYLVSAADEVWGYFKHEGEIDTIGYGSFGFDPLRPVGIYLKNEENLSGNILKNGELLKLKWTDRSFNKLGKFKFERKPQEGVDGNYRITPTSYGGEMFTYFDQSGLAVSQLDKEGEEVDFVFWWHHKSFETGQGLRGTAKKIDEDDAMVYYSYESPEPMVNGSTVKLRFELSKNRTAGFITMEVDTNNTLRFPQDTRVAIIYYEGVTPE